MSHTSRSMTNLDSTSRYEPKPRSHSRSRMVIERTEVKQGSGPRNEEFMQVEVSMSMETMLDEVAHPPYRAPIKIQYSPASTLARAEFISDTERWAQNGRINGSSLTEIDEKRTRLKTGSLREFLSDYENIVGGEHRSQTVEKTKELEYKEESTFEATKTRFGGSTDPIFNIASKYPYSSASTVRAPSESAIQAPSSESPLRVSKAVSESAIRIPTESTITTETTITTTTEITNIAQLKDGGSDMSNIPVSRVPPRTAPPAKADVSALTQQFEMNAKRNWMDSNGMKWTPKGGPKAKELPQFPSNVEFRTTPAGSKYKKVEYELIDSKISTESDGERSRGVEKKSAIPPTASESYSKSPISRKEQIAIYEYDEKREFIRRTDDADRSSREKEVKKIMHDTTPRKREYIEESKITEVWSSTSRGTWSDKHSFPSTTPSQSPFTSASEAETRTVESWAPKIRAQPDADRPSDTASSTTVIVKDSDWTSNIHATENWDTSRRTTFPVASSLEKTKELDEMITVPEEKKSAKWAVIKSTRQDDKEQVQQQKHKDETLTRYDGSRTALKISEEASTVYGRSRTDMRMPDETSTRYDSGRTEKRISDEVPTRYDSGETALKISEEVSTRYDKGQADTKIPDETQTRYDSSRTDMRMSDEVPTKYATDRKDTKISDEATTRYDRGQTHTRSTRYEDSKTDRKPSTEMFTRQRLPVKPIGPSTLPKMSERKSTDSITTTTTEFKIGGKSDMDHASLVDYRSTISARPTFQRTNGSNITSSTYSTTPSGGRILKTVTEFGSSSIHSGGLSPFGQSAASTIRDTREREKKEMSDLNDRLASYIEKVRFLEAQNRKLAADLDLLRGRWGKDTMSVRSMYEGELQEARKVVRDTEHEREDLERQIRKLTEELAEYRRKYDDVLHGHQIDRNTIDDLLSELCGLEAEINLLRRRVANLEEEVSRIKKDNLHFANELNKARANLDQETLNRIDFQNQVQTLLEEIDFIRRVHEQEIGELQTLASRDTTPENREYFKNELSSAIRDIRAEYDQICNVNRTDMESWYKLKVQEIQTQSTRQSLEQGYAKEEVKRLRVQLSDLRGKLADLEGRNSLLEKQTQELNYQLEDDQRSYEAALNDRDAQIRKMREECQALMLELQMLLDTKQTLDAEIAIYRKMLEGEENRAGLRQLVEQVVKTHGLSQVDETDTLRVMKGETASRTSFQRSAKGNVSIQDASPDGKFILLENTHRSKEEFIGDWKLKRKIDGKREIVYTFPRDFVLRPGKFVKIWARGQGGVHSPPDQLIFEGEDTFGSGSNVQTILFNREGEERATHIQRSSYTIN